MIQTEQKRIALPTGVTLNVHFAGTGADVLLLHGITGCGLYWSVQIANLVASGYRVIAPDGRGHGTSDRAAEYATSTIAEDAAALITELGLHKPTIIGHSMGGLIWLEILDRHREWWGKVHSLVLVGSPVGGSDLGRLFDPLRLFPLIARDLGTNRRPIAEAIAAQIPTLSIVGDLGNHSDGTVPIGSSQFDHASFVWLDNINHPTLKNHPRVAYAVRHFWQQPKIAPIHNDTASQLIAQLRAIDLTETNNQNFSYAKVIRTYPDGTKLWIWKNSLQVDHLFVSKNVTSAQGSVNQCIYSAYMGWKDKYKLANIIQD